MDKTEQLKVNATVAELVQQRDMALNRCVEMRIQVEELAVKVKELETPKPKKVKNAKPDTPALAAVG
jgi:hypothetical protein